MFVFFVSMGISINAYNIFWLSTELSMTNNH
jgi:hypothetical protein